MKHTMHGHSVTVSRVGQHLPHYLANDMGAMFTSLSYSKLSFMITKYSKSYLKHLRLMDGQKDVVSPIMNDLLLIYNLLF